MNWHTLCHFYAFDAFNVYIMCIPQAIHAFCAIFVTNFALIMSHEILLISCDYRINSQNTCSIQWIHKKIWLRGVSDTVNTAVNHFSAHKWNFRTCREKSTTPHVCPISLICVVSGIQHNFRFAVTMILFKVQACMQYEPHGLFSRHLATQYASLSHLCSCSQYPRSTLWRLRREEWKPLERAFHSRQWRRWKPNLLIFVNFY